MRMRSLLTLSSLPLSARSLSTLPPRSVLIQGSSRGIGLNLVKAYMASSDFGTVFATCRNPAGAEELQAVAKESGGKVTVLRLDVADSDSIEAAAALVKETTGRLHTVLNVAGVLKDDNLGIVPERRAQDFSPTAALAAFQTNALGPMAVASSFLPLLTPVRKSPDSREGKFVSFSARVGSIGDNSGGGWHTYRASKAAANMYLRTLSIEYGRQNVAVVSLHPGTVDTDLTRNFLKARAKYEVREVGEACKGMMELVEGMTVEKDGGSFQDYKGEGIEW